MVTSLSGASMATYGLMMASRTPYIVVVSAIATPSDSTASATKRFRRRSTRREAGIGESDCVQASRRQLTLSVLHHSVGDRYVNHRAHRGHRAHQFLFFCSGLSSASSVTSVVQSFWFSECSMLRHSISCL